MPEIVGIPKLGLSDFGELISWEAAIDERVTAGDVLAVIESDKASAEVEAPVDGVLLAVYVEEGEEIEIEPGRPIAAIGESGEEPPPASAVASESVTEADASEAEAAAGDDESDAAGADSTADEATRVSPRARRAAGEADADVDLAAIVGTGPQGSVVERDVLERLEAEAASTSDAGAAVSRPEVRATPSARRLARERGVDLDAVWDAVDGRGAITTTEVRAHLDGDRPATDRSDASGRDRTDAGLTVTDRRTLSRTRRTIAERLSESAREKPHVMGTREIGVEHLRRAQSELSRAHDTDASLSDLILYAVGRTLRDLPAFNAHFVDGEHRLYDEVNVGYAVDGPEGLVVPVVENVATRPFPAVATDRERLVNRVLENEHAPPDLQGGTFTVTNVGAFDMDVSYSIINPPQVAILAIGRAKQRPVERDGEVAFEEAVTFSLTIDHRVLDGADSGRFLDTLAGYLQFPGRGFESL